MRCTGLVQMLVEGHTLAPYASNDPDLLAHVEWTSMLFVGLTKTQDVPSDVESGAGPFNW